jgi:hypothetical protein
MKKSLFVLSAAAAAFLAGCIVSSVSPYYTAKDLVFEPALVGDWVKESGNANDEVWKFDKSGDRAYRFTLIETQKATVMEAHAFKLGGQLFLDVFSLNQEVDVIPPHYLLKVSQVTPTLKLSQLDNDRLRSLLQKEPNAIAHHLVKSGDSPDDLRVVLTAGTSELQKFILQQLKTNTVWTEDMELKR